MVWVHLLVLVEIEKVVPTTTLLELVKLFVAHVFFKHEVFSHVTSNRGPEFVSHLFHSLSRSWTSTSTSPLNIIQRRMAKLSKLIKLWSNTSVYTAIISRII